MGGTLVLITGISGTGKTKLCEEIVNSPLPNAVHLNKDTMLVKYARMKGLTAEEVLKDYEKEREFVYDMYYELAEKELEKGRSVLLDNPHVKELLHPDKYPGWRQRINVMLERTNSRLVFIKCYLGKEKEYRKRLEARNLQRDIEKLETSEKFRKFLKYEPLDFPNPKGSLVVDTSKKVDVQKVIDFIENSEGIKL